MKEDILDIISSNKPSIIQKYLEDYVILLENRINQYTVELKTQSLSCPKTLLPSLEEQDNIDRKLKEFVRLHHLDLLRTVNYQISKLNSDIHIKNLSKQLSSFHLTVKQVPLLMIQISYIFFSLSFYVLFYMNSMKSSIN